MRGAWLAVAVAFVVAGCDLDVPAINLHADVMRGGRAQVDAGFVVDVIKRNDNGKDLPGIWLAGHRTTHGAVFANVPNLAIGDEVCVYGVCYRVVDRMVVNRRTWEPRWLGPVVLQTSLEGNDVLLVICQ